MHKKTPYEIISFSFQAKTEVFLVHISQEEEEDEKVRKEKKKPQKLNEIGSKKFVIHLFLLQIFRQILLAL